MTQDLNHEFQYVKIAYTCLNGLVRGKTVPYRDYLKLLNKPVGFYNGCLASDYQDNLLDNFPDIGWGTGFPDATGTIVPHTLRPLPLEPNTGVVLCEMSDSGEGLCGRTLLRSLQTRAEQQGYQVLCGMDYEFTLFDESPKSVQQKRAADLKRITPGIANSSILRTAMYHEFYQSLFDGADTMRAPIESLHTEAGPGCLEFALSKDAPVDIADKVVLLKHFIKHLSFNQGWMSSFMAKPTSNQAGQSGHIHMSLRLDDDTAIFHDPKAPHQMSQTMCHFLAGVLHTLPEWMSLYAPTINSYARLVPDYWAPLNVTWGMDNRTTAARVITGEPTAVRIELRVPGADVNPYLALSAMLAGGLFGIDQKLELQPATYGNGFAGDKPLSRHLGESTELLSKSELASEFFGQRFVSGYTALKQWEVMQHQKAVTDWEVSRYFETV